MSLFVAALVIIIGIAMIIAGVDGTGLGLFTGITGLAPTTKASVGTPQATTSGSIVPAVGTSAPAQTGGLIAA